MASGLKRRCGTGWAISAGLMLACGLADVSPATAQEARSGGPLRTMERSPVYRIFLTPAAESADLLSDGQTQLGFGTTYSNIFEWIRTPRTEGTLDMERWLNQFEFRYGFAPGWEVGTRLGVRTDWGGFLDPLVQWWHNTIGLPNGDREKTGDGEFELTLRRDNQLLLSRPGGTHLEDPLLFLARQLVGGPSDDVALAARMTAKVPLGASATNTGSLGWALQFDGRRSWSRWHLHGGLGMTTLDAPAALDPFVRDRAWFGHLGTERSFQSFDLHVQFQGGGAYLEGFEHRELDRAPLNLAVGASWSWLGWDWQSAFVEDIRPNSPSVDFTIDLRIRRPVG